MNTSNKYTHVTGEPGRSPIDHLPDWQRKIIFKTKRGTKLNLWLRKFFLKPYYRKNGLIYGKLDKATAYICSDKEESSYLKRFMIEQCQEELIEEFALLHKGLDEMELEL